MISLWAIKRLDYIRNTNPIVIIDEPQSVDNTEKSKEAIESLNPLAVLRYSATHRESINTLYKLTPVDAYQNGLVKQIKVLSHSIENDFNKAYIKLISVSNKDCFKAKIELDISNKKGEVSIKTKLINQGDMLNSFAILTFLMPNFNKSSIFILLFKSRC